MWLNTASARRSNRKPRAGLNWFQLVSHVATRSDWPVLNVTHIPPSKFVFFQMFYFFPFSVVKHSVRCVSLLIRRCKDSLWIVTIWNDLSRSGANTPERNEKSLVLSRMQRGLQCFSFFSFFSSLGALSVSVTSGPRLSSCHSSGHIVLLERSLFPQTRDPSGCRLLNLNGLTAGGDAQPPDRTRRSCCNQTLKLQMQFSFTFLM